MTGMERGLFGLGKEVDRVSIGTIRPTTSMGIISSGMIFVGSRTSKSKLSACASLNTWMPNSHSGKAPLAIAS